MKKLTVNVYLVVVLAVSAVLVVLAGSNIPFTFALAYLLPMNVAIVLFEMMHLESIALFYLTFIVLTLIFISVAFLPLLLVSKFRAKKWAVLAQIVALIVYMAISRMVFDRTGSWTSV